MDEEVKIEGNLDINQALAEFEQKSRVEGAARQVLADPVSETPWMLRWVIKMSGRTLDEKQASYILFALAALIFGVSLFLFFGGGSSRPTPSSRDLLLTPPASSIPS